MESSSAEADQVIHPACREHVYFARGFTTRGTMQAANGGDRLSAGKVARLLNVGVQTLHFYEREGLVPPVPRTPAGYRVYETAVIERLRFIKQAQALGLCLAEVKGILSLADCGGSPCGRVQDALEQKLVDVDRRLTELRRFRRDLATLVEKAKSDYATRPGAQVCPIVEHAEPVNSVAAGDVTMGDFGTLARRRVRARGRRA